MACPYLLLLSLQPSFAPSRVFSEPRCDSLGGSAASWLRPPTSCFRGSRKDSASSRYVDFWIPHLWLSHTEPRVMATSHGEYRGYLRNTIDMEAGHNRFQSVQTSDSTYRSILFGTLVVMGLLQVASSIAILLHLTGYLQEVRLRVVCHFHSHLLFDITGPVCVKLCLYIFPLSLFFFNLKTDLSRILHFNVIPTYVECHKNKTDHPDVVKVRVRARIRSGWRSRGFGAVRQVSSAHSLLAQKLRQQTGS